MAWVDISEDVYKVVLDTPNSLNAEKNVWLTLQYDDERDLTPTSVRIRFKLSSKNNSNYWDQFFILIPQSEDGKFIKIKEKWTGNGGAKYPYYWPADPDDSGYKITKNYASETFTIPAFFFIDGGQDAIVASGSGYTAANVTTSAQAYHIATTNSKKTIDGIPVVGRANYTQAVGSKKIEISSGKTVAAAGGTPTLTLNDNGNNTVTVTVGNIDIDGGTNNKLESVYLYYTINNSEPSTEQTSPAPISLGTSYKTVSKKISVTKYKTPIKVLAVCNFKQNKTSATKSITAKYYVKPTQPGLPINMWYDGKKLTAREPWNYFWTASEPANGDSLIAGYDIMLMKKAKGESDFKYIYGLLDAGNDHLDIMENVESDDNYFLRRNGNTTNAILEDPSKFGIKAGDTVKLFVKAFTWNDAKPTKQVIQSDSSEFEEWPVENAGVVRVKVPQDGWVEGQVWVRADNTWHEAELVNVKTPEGWKESQ